MPTITTKSAPKTDEDFEPKELAAEDFYLEDGLVVFTAAYHLKRGYCCESGCRHCPYVGSG
jgi:hypothetical protein